MEEVIDEKSYRDQSFRLANFLNIKWPSISSFRYDSELFSRTMTQSCVTMHKATLNFSDTNQSVKIIFEKMILNHCLESRRPENCMHSRKSATRVIH